MPTIVLDNINLKLQTAAHELQNLLIDLRDHPQQIDIKRPDLERLVKAFNKNFPNRLQTAYFHPNVLKTLSLPEEIQPLIDFIQSTLLPSQTESNEQLDQPAAAVSAETDKRPQLETTASLKDIIKRFNDQARSTALKNQELLAQQYAAEAASDQQNITRKEVIKQVDQLEKTLKQNVTTLIQASKAIDQSQVELILHKYDGQITDIIHRAVLTPQPDKNYLTHHLITELDAANIEGLNITRDNKSALQLQLETNIDTEPGLKHVVGMQSNKYIDTVVDIIQYDSPKLVSLEKAIETYLVAEKQLDPTMAQKTGKTIQDTALAYALTGTKITPEIIKQLPDVVELKLDTVSLNDISTATFIFTDFAASNPLVQNVQQSALNSSLTPEMLLENQAPLFSLFETLISAPESDSLQATHQSFDTLMKSFSLSEVTRSFWEDFRRIATVQYTTYFALAQNPNIPDEITAPYNPPDYQIPNMSLGPGNNHGLLGRIVRGFASEGNPGGILGQLLFKTGLPSELSSLGLKGFIGNAGKLTFSRILGQAGIMAAGSFSAYVGWILGGIAVFAIIVLLLVVSPNTLLRDNIAPVEGRGGGGIGGGYCNPADPTCPIAVCRGDCFCPTNCGSITQGPDGSYSHAPNSLNAVDIGLGNCVGNRNIFSITDGCVVAAGFDSVIGERVVIQNSDGTQLTYAHLEEYNFQAGPANCQAGDPNYVARGTQIGIGDDTGTSSGGHHLHLEYRNPGGPPPPNVLSLFFSDPQEVSRLTRCSSDAGCGICQN